MYIIPPENRTENIGPIYNFCSVTKYKDAAPAPKYNFRCFILTLIDPFGCVVIVYGLYLYLF